MSDLPTTRFARKSVFPAVLWTALAFAMLKAVAQGWGLEDSFSDMGSDDMMRLVMVRDWIAGQSWYDTTQYRMAPPEGVSMHWSRYIDACIAAIIVPLSWFLPMHTAEMVAAMVWPTLIFICAILVTGFGTRRLFGDHAACFAVLMTVLWPLTGDLHMRAGNLDHHNVQFLMMTVLVFGAVWPTQLVLAGMIGGLAAAFSVSTGLETVPFIAAAGLIVFARSLRGPVTQTGPMLVAFAGALLVGSVLLWLGLTAPSAMARPVCDQLGTPMLSLIAVAAVAAIAPVYLRRRTGRPAVQFIATAGLAALGLALAWPLLGPCLAGPYGNLPEDLQEVIRTNIVEAKPLHLYVQTRLSTAIDFVVPVAATLLAGFALWRHIAKAPDGAAVRAETLGWLLVLGALGALMIASQMRTVAMVATVVPVIGGAVLARLLAAYLATRRIGPALALFGMAIATMAPGLLLEPLRLTVQPPALQATARVGNCRSYQALVALNAIPPANVLTHMNHGAALIWATHHATLSGPYHRSATAYANGFFPWSMNEADMRDAVMASPATHVLICKGFPYPPGFAQDLAAGAAPVAWLRPVPLSGDTYLMFEVVR